MDCPLDSLIDTGTRDGWRALLVLDGAAGAAASLNRPDDLVGLDIALGHTSKHNVLAVQP